MFTNGLPSVGDDDRSGPLSTAMTQGNTKLIGAMIQGNRRKITDKEGTHLFESHRSVDGVIRDRLGVVHVVQERSYLL